MRSLTGWKLKTRLALFVCVLLAGCVAPPDDGEAPPSRAQVGETIYRQYCFSCHGSGINGAPRVGDAAAWRTLREKGDAALLKTTKEGIQPYMPEMGLCMTCSDEELVASIDYMMQASELQ